MYNAELSVVRQFCWDHGGKIVKFWKNDFLEKFVYTPKRGLRPPASVANVFFVQCFVRARQNHCAYDVLSEKCVKDDEVRVKILKWLRRAAFPDFICAPKLPFPRKWDLSSVTAVDGASRGGQRGGWWLGGALGESETGWNVVHWSGPLHVGQRA